MSEKLHPTGSETLRSLDAACADGLDFTAQVGSRPIGILLGCEASRHPFLTHPLWRAYISTYVEGYDLLSRWLSARPADQPVADRFVRLLDEPLTPRAVAGELLGV